MHHNRIFADVCHLSDHSHSYDISGNTFFNFLQDSGSNIYDNFNTGIPEGRKMVCRNDIGGISESDASCLDCICSGGSRTGAGILLCTVYGNESG